MSKLSMTLLFSIAMANGPVIPGMAQSLDGGIKAPVDYDTLQPPAPGSAYVDPIFGSTIRRVSNALNTHDADRGGNLTWITDEYSTMSPFNSDNSRIILVHQSYFALYDGGGSYLRDLPLEVNSSSEPRWSRRDPNTVYYVSGNRLKSCNVTTGATAIVHTFSEYTSITGKGESDISVDGDHFVFAGEGRYVFIYEISTGKTSQVLDTAGRGFDSLYITPRNNVTITWTQSGTVRNAGIEMYDKDMRFQRQIAHAGGHMDVAQDVTGEEVMLWINANDPQPICNNGVVKIRLSDAFETCLISLDWSLAVHISAPDASGFVYVETYAPGNPQPSAGWVPYANELLQVKLDGSQVMRLAHHRSRPWNSYGWQPKMSTSRDGSRVVFNSNYDQQATNGYPAEYSDVYLMVLGALGTPVAPTPTPTPVPTPTPTAGTISRFEQDNAAVEKVGAWFPNNGAVNSGGSSTLAMDKGSRVNFTFTGTGVKWIGFRDQWSGIAQVYIDGALQSTINTYSGATETQAAIYSTSSLSSASHVLSIVVTGTYGGGSNGSWVWVDAFDVTTDAATRTSKPGRKNSARRALL